MNTAINWAAVDADPRFRQLHRRKTRMLLRLMIFSIAYYFLLPVGAAYFQDFFRMRIWGPVNVGVMFALSEFIAAWGIAFYYSRVAGRVFDEMAKELLRDAERIGRSS